MKLSTICQTFAIASFATSGLATLLFDPLPSKLAFGDKVKLNWTADHDYVSINDETAHRSAAQKTKEDLALTIHHVDSELDDDETIQYGCCFWICGPHVL